MTRSREVKRGYLVSVGIDPEVFVAFQYNPSELTDKRTVTYATMDAPGSLTPARQYTSGDRTMSFIVLVDGLLAEAAPGSSIDRDADGGIGPELAKYRAFVHPRTGRWRESAERLDGFTGLYEGSERVFRAPPSALFGFGDRVVDCVVTEMTITEQLFTAGLAPLRASIQVSLAELSPYADAQSGGPA